MKFEPLNIRRQRKARSHLEKAGLAQKQGLWEEAYRAYSLALQEKGQDFAILVQLGHMSKEMGQFEKAERHYFDAFALKPDDWDLNLQIGHFFNRTGDLVQATEWYQKANALRATKEVSELLQSIDARSKHQDTHQLRRSALEKMDTRRFKAALPEVLALYHDHGLRDFDVIVGHAFRELGRFEEAKEMYLAYFDRCASTGSRFLKDALLQLVNILDILEQRQEILKLLSRFKTIMNEKGGGSDLGQEVLALQDMHIGKLYGVFRV